MTSSGCSSASSLEQHEYDDIASRTLIASVVFSGTFVMTSQELILLSNADDALSRGASVVTASFIVHKLYKGNLHLDLDLSSVDTDTRIVVVGTRVAGPVDDGDDGEGDCTGLKRLQENTSYLIFLNGSTSGGEGGDATVYWELLDRPELLTKREERVVEKLSCPKCKGKRGLKIKLH